MHGLVVTGIFCRYLLAETLRLVLGIIQLGKAIGQLAAADEELEAVSDKGIRIATPGRGKPPWGRR